MRLQEKHKKLLGQILKFAFVGGTSFVIDFVITMIIAALCRKLGCTPKIAASIGTVFGFTISLIYNYIMSMHFVFERRDDLSRKTEFLIFTILSLVGLALNAGIVFSGMLFCEKVLPQYYTNYTNIVTAGVKIVATGVVMIYNFISRKLTLEKKQKEHED